MIKHPILKGVLTVIAILFTLPVILAAVARWVSFVYRFFGV